MYCPRCATQNSEGTKFCRQCGTSLEAVALAVIGRSPNDKAIKRKRNKKSEGLNKIAQGAGLLTASALLGVVLGVFSHNPDWPIIWLVLVGWMSVFGVLSLTSGIAHMLESRLIGSELSDTPNELVPGQILSPANRDSLPNAVTAKNLAVPPSVTERTTNLLTEPRSKATPQD